MLLFANVRISPFMMKRIRFVASVNIKLSSIYATVQLFEILSPISHMLKVDAVIWDNVLFTVVSC